MNNYGSHTYGISNIIGLNVLYDHSFCKIANGIRDVHLGFFGHPKFLKESVRGNENKILSLPTACEDNIF